MLALSSDESYGFKIESIIVVFAHKSHKIIGHWAGIRGFYAAVLYCYVSRFIDEQFLCVCFGFLSGQR